LSFYAWDTGTKSFQLGADIRAIAAASHGDYSIPTYLSFLTTPSGTDYAVEGMRLTEDGGLRVTNFLQVGTTTQTASPYTVGIQQGSGQQGIVLTNDAYGMASGIDLDISLDSYNGTAFFGHEAYCVSGGYKHTNNSAGATVMRLGAGFNIYLEDAASTAGSWFTNVYPGLMVYREVDDTLHISKMWLNCDGPYAGDEPFGAGAMLMLQRASHSVNSDLFLTLTLQNGSGEVHGECGIQTGDGNIGYKLYSADSSVGLPLIPPFRMSSLVSSDETVFFEYNPQDSSVAFGQIEQLALSYYGYAHGITSVLPTDEWMDINPLGTDGVILTAIGTNRIGLHVESYCTIQPTDGLPGAARGVITFNTHVKSGTGGTSLSGIAGLFSIQNHNSCQFLLLGDGTVYANASFNTFDDYEDALACRDAMYAMSNNPARVIAYNQERLQEMGVMRGGMVSFQGVTGLLLGGVGELYQILEFALKKLGLDYHSIRREIRGLA